MILKVPAMGLGARRLLPGSFLPRRGNLAGYRINGHGPCARCGGDALYKFKLAGRRFFDHG